MTETELDNLLEERLLRLEMGEPLEACLVGLPESEANMLKKAAWLRAVTEADPAADQMASGRRDLLRLAKEHKPMAQPLSASTTKARPRWFLPTALAGGAFALFICATLFAVLAGLVGLNLFGQNRNVAQNHTLTPAGTSLAPAATPAPTEIAREAPDPQTAALQKSQGMVEVQTSDGTWTRAPAGTMLKAGQRIRTGALSSVTLAFYDGSQAQLGPNSEVAIDSLDAQKSGPRVILLTQQTGESNHEVAPSDDTASRYEVSTPSGTGAAKGTAFHVLVTTTIVRFDVDEGEVAVTNLDVTVAVVAGQSTIVNLGESPDDPLFRVSGEGAVEAVGDAWLIAGQNFMIDDNTLIQGDPHVGDWVHVQGRLLPNGTRLADLIILLHRSRENRFVFTGEVQVISATQWTIAGQVVRVDEQTTIEAGIAIGDLVEAQGGVAQDGVLWASLIRRVVPNSFRFTGVVQSISPDIWAVSGISVAVNLSTTIESGIVVGDRVQVTGQILDDGTWMATSIQNVTSDLFDFAGIVLSIDPWNVGGLPFETDANTEIDEGITIGNRVRVTGRVLADGAWLAESITQLDEGQRHHIEFTGRVRSMNPWNVGGVAVTVDDLTKIKGEIQIGDLVLVKGNLLTDGAILAKEIKLVRDTRGCFDVRAVVQTVDAAQIVLLDGQTINPSQGVSIQGNLQVASVVIVHICLADNGSVVVVSIVVIFQLSELPPLPPPVQGCPGIQAVVVVNGVITLPNGQLIQLDDNTWIQMEVKGKGDKVEVKLNGQKDPKIEIKVKIKGKHPEIEVKAKGKGASSLILIGAGKYPITSTVALTVCNTQAGPVFIVNSGAILTDPPHGPPP